MQNYTNGIGGNIPQQNKEISSPAVAPQANPKGYKDIFYQLEQAIGADVQKVRTLVQKGTITQQEGQYLMGQLARKANEINAYKNSANIDNASVQQPPMQPVQVSAMDMFNQERPGFFESEGRGDVLNYIKGYDMDKDEISRIAQLVEGLENSAVDKYLRKSAYEKSLNDENSLAKSKLTAYAQNAFPDSKTTRIFTREDIGNMSGEEFTQNEKMIMDQLKQGLIK
ncbi:MAG: hypothetical protein E7Z87_03670 [Cyanobacteria bacterium SIG26]|nr:hypothetical protein [Cyanobacteria bacterium SIG26]